MSLPLTTFVEFENHRFLIMDAPNDANVHLYIKEMNQVSCADCVRVCEATYEASTIAKAGVTVHDLPFTDGESPPAGTLAKWLDIVDAVAQRNKTAAANPATNPTVKTGSNIGEKKGRRSAIAIHCIAGLGRAPMMVAIAFIESGLDW